MFKGRHFDQSVILLCVRWYLAYNLSLRDLEEMMAERGTRHENLFVAAAGRAIREDRADTVNIDLYMIAVLDFLDTGFVQVRIEAAQDPAKVGSGHL